MTKLTPAQQQYMDMKKEHADCLLLFRMWDFYECFYEDAEIAHRVLGITLTARDKTSEHPIPMAGIPHHALDKYVPKLIHAGHKVALADQIGEVVPWKLVQRAITQIITPWTRIEEWASTCTILSITQWIHAWYLARWDVSTGIWTTKSCTSREQVMKWLMQAMPQEILLYETVQDIGYWQRRTTDHGHTVMTVIAKIFDEEMRLKHTLSVQSLQWFGAALEGEGIQACAALFWYLQHNKQQLYIRRIESYHEKERVGLDILTVKNLELFQWSYQWSKKHSLYAVIDCCRTSMWSRLLAERLKNPIQQMTIIRSRHDAIEYRYTQKQNAMHIAQLLQHCGDFPRMQQKIRNKKEWILTLASFATQVRTLLQDDFFVWYMHTHYPVMITTIQSCIAYLDACMAETIVHSNDRVREWFDEQVDMLRAQSGDSDTVLLEYQQRLIQKTGVAVKIKYVIHQWYFLEVTPKDQQRFESYVSMDDEDLAYVRAQTLKTGQRYSSWFLQNIQATIYKAKEALLSYQDKLATELRQYRCDHDEVLQWFSDAIASIDVAVSMALFSDEHGRTKPQMHTWFTLSIRAWRHPVLEKFLPITQSFVPNDALLEDTSFFHCITWPNMGGKSTYLRQTAIIVLLAHVWLRVPAKEATIPVIDALFARVWSGDILAQQQSTFMTEMLETAAILHNATNRSLIIIDELGRGTSTYDGVALAKAISVYICRYIYAKTLFATHYHELILLQWQLPWFTNKSVAVHETDKELVFLKKIVQGATDKSYGIDVAQMAWIPLDILVLAREYLQQLHQESSNKKPLQQGLWFTTESQDTIILRSLRARYEHLDINTITPIEAMQILQELLQQIA